MMGYDQPPNDHLFSYHVQFETRVRKDHPLRKIKELIDFDFIYNEVKKTYGDNGNVSVPPPVILKLMLLLVFYNVRSERELMDTLPERLDWLWFLGYTICRLVHFEVEFTVTPPALTFSTPAIRLNHYHYQCCIARKTFSLLHFRKYAAARARRLR